MQLSSTPLQISVAPGLIDALAVAGVRLVGVDTPSVDPYASRDLPVHRRCLAHDMGILEGLVLADVPAVEVTGGCFCCNYDDLDARLDHLREVRVDEISGGLLVNALEAFGIRVEAAHHEVAYGQHEIDFQYSDALTSCDRFIFFRYMTKHYAKEEGLLATFMPKPFANRTGNGAHFNMSLRDLESGENLFACDPADDPRGLGLTELGYHFIGGIIRHGRALCAVFSPTVNSYKRLVRQGDMATWIGIAFEHLQSGWPR